MAKRKPISDRMKLRSVFHWYLIACPECHEVIHDESDAEWDHRHALCFDGSHEPGNIMPMHIACHTAKTIRDIKANAKVKRLEAKRTGKPERRKKKWASRPMQSRNSFKR